VREKTKFNIAGFGDLGWEEVARLTNLSPQGAKLAKQREYDETFIIEKGAERKILKALKSQGLQIQFGGKFYDASSPKSNKGKAVKILSSLFRKKFGKIKTMGLGDSPNDFPMLKAVDLPVLVQKPSGIWSLNFKNLTRIKAVGPRGWKTAVKKFVLNNG